MVACLSPADNNYDETLSTLRYANRAKNIYNEPHVNEDPKDTMLRQYQEQIKKLQELLEASTAQLPIKNGLNDISEKEKLRLEYQDEMIKLREKYQEEYNSKCQMQADLKILKEKYDQNLAKITNQVRKLSVIYIIIVIINKQYCILFKKYMYKRIFLQIIDFTLSIILLRIIIIYVFTLLQFLQFSIFRKITEHRLLNKLLKKH